MLTPQQTVSSMLREVKALDEALLAIGARADLAEAFVWQCIIAAIRARQATLIERAHALVTLSAEALPAAPILAADTKPDRVH